MPAFKDLTGQRFGRLIAFKRGLPNSNSGKSRWRCLCDCGKERTVALSNLTDGHTKSCGCLQRELSSDALLTFKPKRGRRFGRLKIIEETTRSAAGKRRFLCRCDCGNERVVPGSQLTAKRRPTRSCGACSRRRVA